MGHCKSSAKGWVHSHTGIAQETRKKSNKNLTLHLTQLEKEEMKNPSVSRRKEILKIRAEINAKEKEKKVQSSDQNIKKLLLTKQKIAFSS